jgi:iron complex outermembrane receptor protein
VQSQLAFFADWDFLFFIHIKGVLKMNRMIIVFIVLFVLLTSYVSNAWASLAQEQDTIVVTASRLEQNNYKIASNVTVITREQIESSNAQNVPDILKQALGVNVYDNSTPKSAVLDIRGFGDTAARNILILVNGRKINNVDISAPELLQIPVGAVDRVEIIRGVGSVLYGDNAVGGVVNIITKRGEGKLKGKVGTKYGSYDTQGVDLEASGYQKNISYFLYSQYLDQRGYRENSDMLAKDFNTRLGYDVSEKISLDMNLGWHEDDQELPGGLTESNLSTYGRRGSANPNDIAFTKDRFVQLSADVDPSPGDDYFGRFALDLSYRNRDVQDSFNSFGLFDTKRSIDTVGVAGKYIFDRTVFGQDVSFVTGVDFYDTENDILGSGTNVDDITISKEELGLFGYLQYELLNDVFVNGGTRYHKADYTFNQRNAVVFQEQSPDEWVSMGGLKYDYAKGSNIHLNVQQSFRFLSTDEWYSTANFPGFGITPGLNLNLEQQTGVQYEAGIKHNFNDKMIVTVTPYWMDLKNEIFFDPVTFANSNYDKTRRVGLEVGQKIDILEFFKIEELNKLEFFTNYAYQNSRFIKGANDQKEIPMAPRYQVTSGLTAGFLKYFNASLLGHYVGSRFAINDNLNATAAIKPYYVLDSKFSFEHDNLEVFVGINNMADRLYSSYVAKSTFSSTKSYFPAPERNYSFGVNLKF